MCLVLKGTDMFNLPGSLFSKLKNEFYVVARLRRAHLSAANEYLTRCNDLRVDTKCYSRMGVFKL